MYKVREQRMQMITQNLLATDKLSTTLSAVGQQAVIQVYTPYGHRRVDAASTALGFTGQFSERGLGWYLLGNGNRAYNPVLMRFHSADAFSPFGKGGINSYAYCLGDPINLHDPSGNGVIGRRNGFDFHPAALTSASNVANVLALPAYIYERVGTQEGPTVGGVVGNALLTATGMIGEAAALEQYRSGTGSRTADWTTMLGAGVGTISVVGGMAGWSLTRIVERGVQRLSRLPGIISRGVENVANRGVLLARNLLQRFSPARNDDLMSGLSDVGEQLMNPPSGTTSDQPSSASLNKNISGVRSPS